MDDFFALWAICGIAGHIWLGAQEYEPGMPAGFVVMWLILFVNAILIGPFYILVWALLRAVKK